ncbi:hypothetical protein GYB29_13515 [bacterium]|jgi:hypothetical protein|nr:hypothetical protein [bacterium]
MLELFNGSLVIGLLVSVSASLIGFLLRKGLEITKNRLPQKPDGVWPTSYFLINLVSILCWVLIGLGLFVGLILVIEYIQY